MRKLGISSRSWPYLALGKEHPSQVNLLRGKLSHLKAPPLTRHVFFCVNMTMDIETIVAFSLLFSPIAILIGVSVWAAWHDKDKFY